MRQGRRGFTLIELLVVIAIIAILAAILFPVFTAAKETARTASCASNMKQLGAAIRLYADTNDGRLPPYSRGSGADTRRWFDFINPYLKADKIYRCPSLTDPKPQQQMPGNLPRQNRIYGYGVNYPHLFYVGNVYAPPVMDTIPRASQILLLVDSYTFGKDENDVWDTVHELGFPVVYCRVTSGPGAHPWKVKLPYPTADGNISGRHGGNTNVLYVDSHVKTWKKEYVTHEYSSPQNSGNHDLWAHFDMPWPPRK